MLQTLRDRGFNPRLLYPGKLSFIIDGENKIFHDKNQFKQYISTNLALQLGIQTLISPGALRAKALGVTGAMEESQGCEAVVLRSLGLWRMSEG